MKGTARVSVVIAVYNGSKFLRPTLDALLAQTENNLEIILVDDASTDDSVSVIETYKDTRIKLLRNPQNLRLVDTRNRGIEASSASLVAICDQDDVCLPNRIKTQADFLDSSTEIGLVASWMDSLLPNGERAHIEVHRRYSSEELKASLTFRNCVTHSTVMFQKALLPAPPYSHEYPLCEDYNLICQMSWKSKIALLPQVLCLYREHDTSYSKKAVAQSRKLAGLVKKSMLNHYGFDLSPEHVELNNELEWLGANSKLTVASAARFKPLLESLIRRPLAQDSERRAFEKIVAQEWREVTAKAIMQDGYAAWKLYRSSFLSSLDQSSFWLKMKFFLKACMYAVMKKT